MVSVLHMYLYFFYSNFAIDAESVIGIIFAMSSQVLEADLAILDEIDSGLDVDALQDVAKALLGLMTPKNSILMITHYPTLLDLINKPGFVHIMVRDSKQH